MDKNRAKLMEKISGLLSQIDEAIAQDNAHSKTASGYRSENARYRAQNCKGCPLRCLCYKAKADRRTIEANHRLNEYKRKARELLTSEDGIKHRGQRCVESEAVFAIAFNIKKMCSKMAKQTKNGGNTPQTGLFFIMLQIFLS